MDVDVRQLPRGRHHLSRETVVASQQGRLLAAVLSVTATNGFSKATVGEVVRIAGVSRETFYEHFASKEDCFLAAVENAMDDLRTRSLPVFAEIEDPLAAIDAFLEIILAWMVQHPEAGHALLIELRTAGEQAKSRDRRWTAGLAKTVCATLGTGDLFACTLYIHGVLRMLGLRLVDGELDTLPELRPELVDCARRLLVAD